MSEQVISSQNAASKTKRLGIAALICLALAAICDLLIVFLPGGPGGGVAIAQVETMLDNTHWIIGGLLLPVSLLLISTSSKKERLSKLFVVLSALAAGIQLACVVIRLVGLGSSAITYVMYVVCFGIPGNDLLSILELLLDPINMNSPYAVHTIVICSLGTLSSLLYILTNVLSLIGFAKLSSKK